MAHKQGRACHWSKPPTLYGLHTHPHSSPPAAGTQHAWAHEAKCSSSAPPGTSSSHTAGRWRSCSRQSSAHHLAPATAVAGLVSLTRSQPGMPAGVPASLGASRTACGGTSSRLSTQRSLSQPRSLGTPAKQVRRHPPHPEAGALQQQPLQLSKEKVAAHALAQEAGGRPHLTPLVVADQLATEWEAVRGRVADATNKCLHSPEPGRGRGMRRLFQLRASAALGSSAPPAAPWQLAAAPRPGQLGSAHTLACSLSGSTRSWKVALVQHPPGT